MTAFIHNISESVATAVSDGARPGVRVTNLGPGDAKVTTDTQGNEALVTLKVNRSILVYGETGFSVVTADSPGSGSVLIEVLDLPT